MLCIFINNTPFLHELGKIQRQVKDDDKVELEFAAGTYIPPTSWFRVFTKANLSIIT
jgi:hypothetical protein